MATNQAVKFHYVSSVPTTYAAGEIYFVQTSTSGSGSPQATVSSGDIYVAVSSSSLVKFTSNVQAVTFSDGTSGSPYTGGQLTVTNKDGVATTYDVASQQDLTALATALNNTINGLNVTGYQQGVVASETNGASITIKGIKEQSGKISNDSSADVKATIIGTGSVTVTQSSNTITINGADSGVTSIQAGNGINVDTTGTGASAASPIVSAKVVAGNGLSVDTNGIAMAVGGANAGAATADGTTTTIDSNGKIGINTSNVDGAISSTNKLATQSTVTTSIGALDGSATIASESNGVVTLKAGVSETDGVISNASGSDITLAKVATTGTAADVAVVDSAGHFTATDVEAALAELAARVENLNQFDYEVVSQLPTASASTKYKIYLVQASGTAQQNVYKEYITLGDGTGSPAYYWELLGDTEIDISTKADKVSGATTGNLASLTAEGNLADSGIAASNVKTKQTAVSDPTASGDATAFIDTISQDTNGEITVTKKYVPTVVASTSGSGGSAGLMTAAQAEKLAGIETGAEVNDVTDVQIGGTSIVSNKVANFTTEGTYNSASNPIATKSAITVTDVKVSDGTNSVSILDSTTKTATFVTNTTYDASTNKIATMSDISAAQLAWETFPGA